MRLFIVDDSAILRGRIIGLITQVPGIEIIGETETVASSIEGIQNLKPEVVILDLRLKDGNGLEVMAQIKLMEPVPIVIIFTNFPHPQYRKRCLAEGADYFFSKKNEFNEVVELLRTLQLKY